MKVAVVFNPKSGSAPEEAQLRDSFARFNVECEPIPLSDSATERIRRAAHNCDMVVAAGGDGTIGSVAGTMAMANATASLGIIPAGTNNDLSRSLKIPSDLDKSIEIVVRGRSVHIDLIRTENDRFVINQANGGFAGAIAREREQGPKSGLETVKNWRSYLDVICGMPNFHLELKIDGEELTTEAISLTVANARTSGGGVPTAPEADYSDGLIDIIIIEAGERAALAALVPKVVAGRHLDSEGVVFRRAKRLEVLSRPELPFSFDGEHQDERLTFFEISQSQLRVRVPTDG